MKHQVSPKESYKNEQKSKINQFQKLKKLKSLIEGRKKVTTAVNYVKKEGNTYCLLVFPEQAEVALNSSKIQLSVVTSRKHF